MSEFFFLIVLPLLFGFLAIILVEVRSKKVLLLSLWLLAAVVYCLVVGQQLEVQYGYFVSGVPNMIVPGLLLLMVCGVILLSKRRLAGLRWDIRAIIVWMSTVVLLGIVSFWVDAEIRWVHILGIPGDALFLVVWLAYIVVQLLAPPLVLCFIKWPRRTSELPILEYLILLSIVSSVPERLFSDILFGIFSIDMEILLWLLGLLAYGTGVARLIAAIRDRKVVFAIVCGVPVVVLIWFLFRRVMLQELWWGYPQDPPWWLTFP